MTDIHSRIKRLRETREISLEALAALCGVSWQAAQQWERPGGTAPKRTRLARVADALGTTQAYLLTGAPPESNESIVRHLAEPSAARYQLPAMHPDVAAVMKLMEAADDRGKAIALGAVRAALFDQITPKKTKAG